jgi:NADH-quinone oxidoreductase subunit N
MNLGAFAVVAFLRNIVGSEDLRDMRGLVYRAPVLVVTLGVFLLSLVGLPPLAGFAAKFQIFAALFDAARTTPSFLVRQSLYTLIVVGGLNTVLSLFYYVKVLKVMVLDKPIEEVEGREPPRLAVPPAARAFAVIMAIFVVYMGIDWDQFASAARTGIGNFPAPAALAQAAPPVQTPAANAEGKH